jgi:hypothetical protein
MPVATMALYKELDIVPPFFFLRQGTVRVVTVVRTVAIKIWKKRGEILISFF